MSAEPREQASADGSRMTIWEHLAELRSRLIKVIVAVAVGGALGWVVYPYVLDFLQRPYCDINPECQLYIQDPLEFFTVRLQISAYIGIALAMPVILWQVWRFVTPGLYPHEKKYAVPFVVSSLVLFVFGAALAYWALTPALEFLLGLGGDEIEAIFSPQKYLTLTTYMMLAFGAGFEVPVLLVALQMIGVVSPRQLLGHWRMAIIVIAVTAAVITPSGDPVTMLALVVPMTVLYFGAIAIGALFHWRRSRKGRTAASATATT